MAELEDFLEQLDAVKDIAHHYTCFRCEEFDGYVPVIMTIEQSDGLRVIVLVACVSCAKEMPKCHEIDLDGDGTRSLATLK